MGHLGLGGVRVGSPFSPLDISGLVLWLRSDLGVTLNGSNVSAWADQSGQGNNVSQGTGAQQPPYVASDASFGGQPSLTFTNGSHQNLGSGVWSVSLVQPCTWYVLAKYTSFAGVGIVMQDISAHQAMYVTANGGAFQISAASAMGSAHVSNGAHAFVGVFNGASSAAYLDASTGPVSGNVGAGTLTRLQVSLSNANNWSGSVAEVMGYSGAHTAANVAQVLQYYNSRYGTSYT